FRERRSRDQTDEILQPVRGVLRGQPRRDAADLEVVRGQRTGRVDVAGRHDDVLPLHGRLVHAAREESGDDRDEDEPPARDHCSRAGERTVTRTVAMSTRPGAASEVTSNRSSAGAFDGVGVSHVASHDSFAAPEVRDSRSAPPDRRRHERTGTAAPSTNARGQRWTARPRRISIAASVEAVGPSATPALAVTLRAGSGSGTGRGVGAGATGATAGGPLGIGVASGADASGGAAVAGGTVGTVTGVLGGAPRVALSSWKKTMFTEMNPAPVSTKSSEFVLPVHGQLERRHDLVDA